MYSTQAHDGPVNGLTYSASYIISVGGDDKICVWERFQGHILNTIHLVRFQEKTNAKMNIITSIPHGLFVLCLGSHILSQSRDADSQFTHHKQAGM